MIHGPKNGIARTFKPVHYDSSDWYRELRAIWMRDVLRMAIFRLNKAFFYLVLFRHGEYPDFASHCAAFSNTDQALYRTWDGAKVRSIIVIYTLRLVVCLLGVVSSFSIVHT